MLKILNIEPVNYSGRAKKILGRIGAYHEIEIDRASLLKMVGAHDVLITRLHYHIDREIIDAASGLKAIVTATTGLDHVNVEYAESKGIAVLSLRGEYAFLKTIKATAEHTWALLLSLYRNIPRAHASVLDGEWDRDRFRGNELKGKRLGIMGLGRIGEMVAKYGAVFDMKVAAWDPMKKQWPQTVNRHDHLDALLAASDILSIHLPLDKTTGGILGKAELMRLPDNAVLINTARGKLVDTDALINALASGKLAGAALDVLPGELEDADNNRLRLLAYARNHVNLLITPHIAGATVESMAATEVFMAKKLVKWVKI